jgi:hypothetical protein
MSWNYIDEKQKDVNHAYFKQISKKPKVEAGTKLEDGSLVVHYTSHFGTTRAYKLLEEIEKVDLLGRPISLVKLGFLTLKKGQKEGNFIVERAKVDFGPKPDQQ